MKPRHRRPFRRRAVARQKLRHGADRGFRFDLIGCTSPASLLLRECLRLLLTCLRQVLHTWSGLPLPLACIHT
jgi:hypothetical protein